MFQTRFCDRHSQLEIELYIKQLNQQIPDYIITQQKNLIPDWQEAIQTLVFLFFQSRCPLDGSDLKAEKQEKDRLMKEFYQWGKKFYSLCQAQKIVAEIICPKDGIPLYSSTGSDIFHLSPLVTRHLSGFTQKDDVCSLIHPQWGQAVYPCLLISRADLVTITSLTMNSEMITNS